MAACNYYLPSSFFFKKKWNVKETLVDFTCYFNSAIPRRLSGLPFSLPFCPLKHFTSLFYFCQTTLDSLFSVPSPAHLAELCSLTRGAKCFSLTFNSESAERHVRQPDWKLAVWKHRQTCTWTAVCMWIVASTRSLAAGSSLPFITLSVLMLPCATKQPRRSTRFSGM